MAEKEKAKELVDKMYSVDDYDDYNAPAMQYEHARKCALIAVDEIIKSQTCCDDFECKHEGSVILRWWGDVKREINNL